MEAHVPVKREFRLRVSRGRKWCAVDVQNAHRFLAHVVELDAGHRLAVFAQVQDKGVRPKRLALDEEIGNGHRLVGHEPLADPVLVRAEVGRVKVECLPARRCVRTTHARF